MARPYPADAPRREAPDVLDDVAKSLKRGRWEQILRGVLAIGFGIFAFARPLATLGALAVLVALWALVSGVVLIIHALEIRKHGRHWWLELLAGVVGVAFGLFAVRRFPTPSITFIVLWVSWWLLTSGVIEIAASMQRRKVGWPWGWQLAIGIVSVVAGIFALMSPPLTLVALTFWIGVTAIAIGIASFADAGGKRRLEKLINSTRKPAEYQEQPPLRKSA
jgi:uncharacterized membrane protein HdeD (DUF308 family)